MATPILNSALWNDVTLGETGTVTLTLVFDQTMNTGVNPGVFFPTGGENAAPALTIQSQAWQPGATSFVITYTINDANLEIANVDYQVQGAQNSSLGETMAATLVNDAKAAGDPGNFNQFALDQVADAAPASSVVINDGDG